MLTFLAEEGLPWGERFGSGGMTLLVGMLTIFAILALLIGVLYLMRWIFYRGDKKTKPQSEPTVSETAQGEGLTEETVAAITAAISICMQEETGTPASFRIRSIKKRI